MEKPKSRKGRHQKTAQSKHWETLRGGKRPLKEFLKKASKKGGYK